MVRPILTARSGAFDHYWVFDDKSVRCTRKNKSWRHNGNNVPHECPTPIRASEIAANKGLRSRATATVTEINVPGEGTLFRPHCLPTGKAPVLFVRASWAHLFS